jgi:hypothetical protein
MLPENCSNMSSVAVDWLKRSTWERDGQGWEGMERHDRWGGDGKRVRDRDRGRKGIKG